MKLGEALVTHNIITQEQLKEALERQVIFGGRIGTNLVELGHIKEEEIMAFFSKYFRTPAVKPAMLDEIDPEVISSLEGQLADQYKIVPFRRDRNRLHVAMLDPRSFDKIEEIRFKTGYDIVPYVVTELRLMYCLERYYGIKRDIRFISVLDKVIDTDGHEDAKDWNAEAHRAAELFASVQDKETVIDILLNEVMAIVARAAVFEVNGTLVTGWKGRALAAEGFEDKVTAPSVYDSVLKRKMFFRGPLSAEPGNAGLIGLLKGTPADCCMFPIIFHEKIVGLLYLDNGNDAVLDAGLGYVSTLVALAEVSFEFVFLRKKLFNTIPQSI